MKRLTWCNKCNENSAVVKCYCKKGELTIKRRVQICLNKGCGVKIDLPPLFAKTVGRNVVWEM